jgi:hypothetical protein
MMIGRWSRDLANMGTIASLRCLSRYPLSWRNGMTKFGVLGATALSLLIATPVLAQQGPADHHGARAGGNVGGPRMGRTGPGVQAQSNFRGGQANANVGTTNNFAARGNAQFSRGGNAQFSGGNARFAEGDRGVTGGGQFRDRDRGRRVGSGAGFAAGAAAAGVATGAAIATSGYGYGYDPSYYGDNYAYDSGYYGDSYAYDYGDSYGYDTGLPVVAFGQPAPVEQTTVAVGGGASYCAQRYRSYDPASGTYLGYDGLRHPCE